MCSSSDSCMEHHVLYTAQRRDVALQCVAFHHLGCLPCDETADRPAEKGTRGKQLDDRQPQHGGEVLHAVLYVGDSHGAVRVVRLRAELQDDDSTSYKLVTTPCALSVPLARTSGSTASSAQGAPAAVPTSGTRAGSGVTFLGVSAALKLLFALVDGKMHVLRLGVAPLAPAMTMQEQMQYFAACTAGPVIAARTTLLCCLAKEQASEASATHTDKTPPCHLALVLDDYRVVLVRCDETAAHDLADGDGTHEATTVASPTVPRGTCVMEWCRHLLLVGTSTQYCLYDVRSWCVLSRLDLVVPLLGGPLVRYLAPCCPPLPSSPDAATSATTMKAETIAGWPSALLFRTAAEELWMYDVDALTRATGSCEARLFRMTPDQAAPAVCDVLSVPPFCLGCSSAGALCLRCCFDAHVWHVPPCQLRGCGSSQVTTTPLGLLYCAPVEVGQTCAVQLWAVPTVAVHCQHLVQCGAYDAALRCLTWYQRQHGGEDDELAPMSTEAMTGKDKTALQTRRFRLQARQETTRRTLYEACARHAMQAAHYEDAFRFFAKANSTPHMVLQCFPELRLLLPPSSSTHAQSQASAKQVHAALAGFRRSYDSDVPYRRVYVRLMQHVLARATRGCDGGASGDDQDAQAVSAEVEEEDEDAAEEEVALFTLIAMHESRLCRLGCTSDERDAFFIVARHLHRDLCLACVDPHGPFAQPSLALLVLACTGAVEAALTQCKERGAVHEAGVVLRMYSHQCERRQGVPRKGIDLNQQDDVLYREHLPWMLATDSAEAMRVVLTPQSHPPSPYELLPILLGHSCESVFHYLHYLLDGHHTGSDTRARHAAAQDTALHTLHALNLVDMIAQMRHIVGVDAPSQLPRQPAGHELGPLGYLRHTLLTFLRESSLYDEWAVLAQLQRHGLAEEQVVVMRHMNDVLGAMQILVYELNDLDAAVQLCRGDASGVTLYKDKEDHIYVSGDNKEANSDVVQQHSSEPHNTDDIQDTTTVAKCRDEDSAQHVSADLGLHLLLYVLMVPPSEAHKPRLQTALWLLQTHVNILDPHIVLRALPDDIALADLAPFLVYAAQSADAHTRLADEERAALRCLVREATRQHTALQRRCVMVDSYCRCAVCHAPLQSAAMLAVFPNLKYAHVKCCTNNRLDPERGVPFRNWFGTCPVLYLSPSHNCDKGHHA